jgi:hypothetical protein
MAGLIAGSSNRGIPEAATHFDSGVTKRIGLLSFGHWIALAHSEDGRASSGAPVIGIPGRKVKVPRWDPYPFEWEVAKIGSVDPLLTSFWTSHGLRVHESPRSAKRSSLRCGGTRQLRR